MQKTNENDVLISQFLIQMRNELAQIGSDVAYGKGANRRERMEVYDRISKIVKELDATLLQYNKELFRR